MELEDVWYLSILRLLPCFMLKIDHLVNGMGSILTSLVEFLVMLLVTEDNNSTLLNAFADDGCKWKALCDLACKNGFSFLFAELLVQF